MTSTPTSRLDADAPGAGTTLRLARAAFAGGAARLLGGLGAADLVALVGMGVMALPPFVLSVAGRSTHVLPVELGLLVAAPLLLWKRGRWMRTPPVTALAVYLIACIPSLLHTGDLPRWLHGWSLLAAGLGILWCLGTMKPRPVQLDRLLSWSPLPFLAIAVTVIVHQGLAGQLLTAGRHKVELAYGGSNYLASILLMGAFIPLARALSSRSTDRAAGQIACFAVIAAAIILTSSRTAMVLLPLGAIMTSAVLVRMRGRSMLRPLIALLVVLVLVGGVLTPFLQSIEAHGRFDDLLGQRNLVLRFLIFDVYFQAFLDSPIVGIGISQARVTPVLSLLGEGQSAIWGGHTLAHNWILQCLGDTGIIGLAGFAAFWWIALRTFHAGAAAGRSPWRPISVGLMIGFIIVTLHGLLEPNFHGRHFFFLFALQLGLAEQIRRTLARSAAGER